ncbi:MAG: uncharacterized protein JWO89_2084 [Verrucomicrobiaceae bacterium]|nr:uncharacterized protein [Verrucomicrobiaceae bacterium]
MSAPASPRLEIIQDEEAFFKLQPEWDALLARSAVRTPFLTWDWVSTWWSISKESAQLCVGVARDHEGTLVAIAPLCICRADTGLRRVLRHLTFLGGIGNIVSASMDFIVVAGQEKVLTLLLCQIFARAEQPWDVIDLPGLYEESPNLSIFRRSLRAFDNPGERSAPHISHSLALPSTWEEYLSSISGNRRNDHRSKWKKMLTKHAGRPLQAGTDLPVEAAMDALFTLHSMRFTTEQSTFLAPDAERFHREIARRWIADGKVMISLLEVEGKMAAARHGFIHDQRYWDYQSGFDVEFSALSIGNLNLAWTAQNAIARGLSEYDHLSGDQPYKRTWSSRVRHLHHLEAFNPRSASAMLFRLVRSAKRLATRKTAVAA